MSLTEGGVDTGPSLWRSSIYIPAKRSLTGEPIAPGDPISQEEAVRQGVAVECPRCHGSKLYSRPKGHKLGCSCHFCGPCPRCSGAGVV